MFIPSFYSFLHEKFDCFLWIFYTRYTVHGRGAKSPLGSNYRVTTTSKKLTILSKNVQKVVQKAVQNHLVSQGHFAKWPVFEQFFQKCFSLLFQILTVQCRLSTPHMSLLKITKNPDTQTDGRDIQFLTLPRT